MRRSPAGGHLTETREAALENGSHQAAGDDGVVVGQAIANLATVAFGLDEAGGPERGQVL